MQNNIKAEKLYDAIDESTVFYNDVHPSSRSKMNVCFRTRQPEYADAFVLFAERHKITGIKGHRSIGGLRAALYNAISIDDVDHLIEVMGMFEETVLEQVKNNL